MAIRMVLSMPERRLRDLRPWEASPGYRMIGAVAATMENEGNPSVVHPGLGAVAVATPPGLRRIVVPVDGSPFAERALPVATWVARALETPIHLVEVVARAAGTEPAIHYLDGLARRYVRAPATRRWWWRSTESTRRTTRRWSEWRWPGRRRSPPES